MRALRLLPAIVVLIAVTMPAFGAAPHRADVGNAVEFLTSLRPKCTLNDVRGHLGKGVSLAGPKWEEYEFAIGNYVRLSGKLQGIVVFLNDAQRKIVKDGRYPDLKPDDPAKLFHPADPIEVATIDLGKVRGKAETAALIQAVVVRLGKPAKREYAQHNDENPSWLAVWKLSGGRTITLSEDSQVHLTATFGTPHMP